MTPMNKQNISFWRQMPCGAAAATAAAFIMSHAVCRLLWTKNRGKKSKDMNANTTNEMEIIFIWKKCTFFLFACFYPRAQVKSEH